MDRGKSCICGQQHPRHLIVLVKPESKDNSKDYIPCGMVMASLKPCEITHLKDLTTCKACFESSSPARN